MRCMLKVTVPMAQGNEKVINGTLGPIIMRILEEQKPEAAYFVEEGGLRCGYIVVDLPTPAHIPVFAEPWFLGLGATVEIKPAMVPADLASVNWPTLVEKHGRTLAPVN